MKQTKFCTDGIKMHFKNLQWERRKNLTHRKIISSISSDFQSNRLHPLMTPPPPSPLRQGKMRKIILEPEGVLLVTFMDSPGSRLENGP